MKEYVMPSQTFMNLKKDKKQRLMDAILKEVAHTPYEHINIQNIIKEALIPRGSFYQYFTDKKDMYTYLFTYIKTIKMAYFEHVFISNYESFFERMEALYLSGLRFKKDYPVLVQAGAYMMASEIYRSSEMVLEGQNAMSALYAFWIKEDQKKGLIKEEVDSELLAGLLMDFLNKITEDSFIYHKYDETAWEKAIRSILEMLKKGIINHV